MTTAVCTIITKRELARARTLMESLSVWQPDWVQHVLLMDEVEGRFDPAREPFFVLPVRNLPVPDKQGTLFYYDIDEARAALKPRLLAWLFDTRGFDSVVYLSPDAWVLAPLADVEALLGGGATFVVTPHLIAEPGDDKAPGEADVLRWGIYNSGFLGASRRGPDLRALLDWWQLRSYRHFVAEPLYGFQRDQRWLDLAVARFRGTTLRSPGYNVAYWNLPERRLVHEGSRYLVQGDLLRFFQFQGFDPDFPERLSPDDQRYAAGLPPAVRRLATEYAAALRRAGHGESRNWPYAFERFRDGTPVGARVRSVYRKDPAVRAECGDDPFKTGVSPFNRAVGRHEYVTRLMSEIWTSRPDLQAAFPSLSEPDSARAFATWFIGGGAKECLVDPAHVEPVRAALARASSGPSAEANPKTAASSPALDTATAEIGPARRPRPARLRARSPSSVARVLELASGVRSVARATLPGIVRRLARGPAAVEVETPEVTPLPPATPVTERALTAGLNIAGYVTADLGVGQSARGAALSAEAAGLPHCLVDFAVGTNSPKTDRTLASKLSADNPFSVNLVHVNADQFPHFQRAMGPSFFEGRYTIGYWHWELPEFPDAWLPSFEGLSEVWVPTDFVLRAVSAKAPIPVVRMPHAISPVTRDPSRARFGLPERKFLFLTMYDLLSYQERKNPRAVLAAFRRAFADSEDVGLVVKVINAEKCVEDMVLLRESLADLPGAVLIPETLSRTDVYDLEAACDAFVSLHRSEGFGLGLAECMFLGKPVVGTAWSGNADFMNARNSCPVDYDLVELTRDHGPYAKGQRWADPDVEHAAFHMKKLVSDPAHARRIGARARELMLTEHSPRAIGALYRARLRLVAGKGF
ncbi:MAG TPA: glycosyltransferase [Polyangiaceae bacterium]|nr:glycosyltransferase [Polyangiaceae bacterium]